MSQNTEILKKLLKRNFDVDTNDEDSLKKFMEDYDDEFVDDRRTESRFKKINRGIDNISYGLKGMKSAIESLVEPWAKVDEAASKYAKTIGVTSEMMRKMRQQAIESVDKNKLAINYGLKAMDLIEAQEKYVKGIGRNVRLDENAQVIAGSISKIIGDTGYELAAALENFGIDMEVTGEHVAGMYNEAAKKGISLEKYAQNVTQNIKLAQNYTFKNGIQGLESMAKKATALKLDMSQVAAFADKVGTVEGAIESAAKLQVLGGPFAQFANPLEMLNEGLTDMEGLTDRVIKMIGGLGSYDKATGQVKVSPFNKLRVKAAADAMGMSYDSLMESVNAQGRRKEIERQIKNSAVASKFSDDMKELIMNSATINKEGKAVISVNGKATELDNLVGMQYEDLVKETQKESDDIKDIARMLRSHFEKRQGVRDQADNKMAKWFGGVGEWISGVYDLVGTSNILLTTIAIATSINTIRGGFSSFSRGGGKGLFKGAGKKAGKGLFGRGGNSVKVTTPAGSKMPTGGETFKWTNGKNYIIKDGVAYGPNGGVSSKSGEIVKAFEKSGGRQVTTNAAANTAMSGGRAALTAGKLMKIGGAIGAVGVVGNMYTNHQVESGKWEKGGSKHTAAKVGFSAAEGVGTGLFATSLASSIATGAGLGTSVGPIGTIIGAAVGLTAGAIVGGVKAAKAKREVALDNKLEQMGIQRKGNYGAHKLKMIDSALETGKISDSLRMKIEREGDFEILAKIEEARKKAEEKAMKENGGINDNIKSASFTIKSASFNGEAFSTFMGKMKGEERVSRPNREERETRGVKAKDAVNFISPVVATYSAVKAVKEKGENPETKELLRKATEQWAEDHKPKQTVVSENSKIELKVSGTIKLEGPNGKQIDITDNLLQDKSFLQRLSKHLVSGGLDEAAKQSRRNEKA